MANESYINKGTEKKVNGEAGADYAWSVEGLATASGRVSAQIDLGALPRPSLVEWWSECQWQGTPTQGLGLDFYVASAPDSDATKIDGDCGQSDAALGDVDMRRNMRPIGAIISENAAASEVCRTSGIFEHTQRYMSLVSFNGAGATINATDSNFIFKFRLVYSQGQ
jgi:hypothetical protein